VEEKHIKPETETNTQSSNNNNNYINRNLSCNCELINVKYKCLERIILIIIIQFNSRLCTQYFLLISVLTIIITIIIIIIIIIFKPCELLEFE
jgi:hypothetical protein